MAEAPSPAPAPDGSKERRDVFKRFLNHFRNKDTAANKQNEQHNTDVVESDNGCRPKYSAEHNNGLGEQKRQNNFSNEASHHHSDLTLANEENNFFEYLSDIYDSWEDKLQCAICIGPFRDPVALNCLHSFCKECIELMVKTLNTPKKIACPTCRKPTQLHKTKGVGGLSRNWYIDDIYDKIRITQALLVRKENSCDNFENMKADRSLERFTPCIDHQRVRAPYSSVCTQCIVDLNAYLLKASRYTMVFEASGERYMDLLDYIEKNNPCMLKMITKASKLCDPSVPPEMIIVVPIKGNKQNKELKSCDTPHTSQRRYSAAAIARAAYKISCNASRLNTQDPVIKQKVRDKRASHRSEVCQNTDVGNSIPIENLHDEMPQANQTSTKRNIAEAIDIMVRLNKLLYGIPEDRIESEFRDALANSFKATCEEDSLCHYEILKALRYRWKCSVETNGGKAELEGRRQTPESSNRGFESHAHVPASNVGLCSTAATHNQTQEKPPIPQSACNHAQGPQQPTKNRAKPKSKPKPKPCPAIMYGMGLIPEYPKQPPHCIIRVSYVPVSGDDSSNQDTSAASRFRIVNGQGCPVNQQELSYLTISPEQNAAANDLDAEVTIGAKATSSSKEGIGAEVGTNQLQQPTLSTLHNNSNEDRKECSENEDYSVVTAVPTACTSQHDELGTKPKSSSSVNHDCGDIRCAVQVQVTVDDERQQERKSGWIWRMLGLGASTNTRRCNPDATD